MALVLRRQSGDKVILSDSEGDLATITIHSIDGRNVELAIDAIDAIEIERGETRDDRTNASQSLFRS